MLKQECKKLSVGLLNWDAGGKRLAALAHVLQTRFLFEPYSPTAAAALSFTRDRASRLFTVDRDLGVAVSTWQSEGLARYARITPEAYLLLCAMLGLVQWRTLALNTLIVPEDFVHGRPSRCLFATQEYKEDYALTLESPFLCAGCVEFYCCLGAETEVFALQRVIDALPAIPSLSS